MTQSELFDSPSVANHEATEQPEEWRQITRFPRYDCSSLGRFRRRSTCKILGGTQGPNGYWNIGLTRDGTQEVKLAHRIIAETFLTQPSPEHRFVNHRNKVKTDNRLCNLEYVTHSENMIHSWRCKNHNGIQDCL